MYELKEEQVAKINAILEQLTKDEDKLMLSGKIERLRKYDNAEERINTFINKDIAEIKKLLSVLKSRKKKEEKDKDKNEIDATVDNIVKQIRDLEFNTIIRVRKKIDEIISEKKEKEIASKKQTIAELEAEIKELEENY